MFTEGPCIKHFEGIWAGGLGEAYLHGRTGQKVSATDSHVFKITDRYHIA
jgi:hypothetical protein